MVGVRGRRSNLGRKKNKKCSESVYVDDFELINLWHAVSIFFYVSSYKLAVLLSP